MAKKPDPGRAPAGSRDAKSGQYVTGDYAKKHPATTVSETRPKPSPPGKKSK